MNLEKENKCHCMRVSQEYTRRSDRLPLSHLQDVATNTTNWQEVYQRSLLPKKHYDVGQSFNSTTEENTRRSSLLEVPKATFKSTTHAGNMAIKQHLKPIHPALKINQQPVACSTVRKPMRSHSCNCVPSSHNIKNVRMLRTKSPREIQVDNYHNNTTLNDVSFDTSEGPGDPKELANYGFLFENKNITYTRGIQLISAKDEEFVDARLYFKDSQNKLSSVPNVVCSSPIVTNVPVRSNSFNAQQAKLEGIRKPAEKTTLTRKLKRRSSVLRSRSAYCLNIYCPVYLEDVFNYSLHQEHKFLLKERHIKQYVNSDKRTMTINWLMQVAEHIADSGTAFYMSIRIFDWIVVHLRLRRHYQLIATTAFWISFKFQENSIPILVPKLYSLCDGKYSKGEFLTMERTILREIKFDLNIPDPLIFLYFFLKMENFEQNELLEYGSRFILDCCVLFDQFPILSPSLLSAAALHVAYIVLNNHKSSYISLKISRWRDTTLLPKYAKILLYITHFVVNNGHINEPLNKYNTAEKLYVSKHFLNINPSNYVDT